MRALTGELDAAGQGHGGAVLVTGDAGVGKSRLAREAIALAASRGYFVLTGRATESAVPVPFRPITEALMGAARSGIVPDAPGISDYRAALGTLVPEWSRPGDGDAEVSPVIFGEALLRMLALPGWPAGLLVLEDLHWADPETLAIVEYLADNIATASVLCLATLRDTEPSAGLDLLHSVSARRAATRVHVPRLTQRAVDPDGGGVPRRQRRAALGHQAARRLRRAAVRRRGDPGRGGLLGRARARQHRLAGQRRRRHGCALVDRRVGAQPHRRARPAGAQRDRVGGGARPAVRLDAAAERG